MAPPPGPQFFTGMLLCAIPCAVLAPLYLSVTAILPALIEPLSRTTVDGVPIKDFLLLSAGYPPPPVAQQGQQHPRDPYATTAKKTEKASASAGTHVLPLFSMNVPWKDAVMRSGNGAGGIRLHIFEPRYRLMARRVIFGVAEGEEQQATLEKAFGFVNSWPLRAGHSEGVVAHVNGHEWLYDGRVLLSAKAGRRFRVKRFWTEKRTKGLIYGEVEFIDDALVN